MQLVNLSQLIHQGWGHTGLRLKIIMLIHIMDTHSIVGNHMVHNIANGVLMRTPPQAYRINPTQRMILTPSLRGMALPPKPQCNKMGCNSLGICNNKFINKRSIPNRTQRSPKIRYPSIPQRTQSLRLVVHMGIPLILPITRQMCRPVVRLPKHGIEARERIFLKT